MNTTAATTSASSGTPNDSPVYHHNNEGASETSNIEQLQQHTQPQLPHPPQQQQPQQQQQQTQPPQQQQTTNEQKRPMNAFLLFCKRQRSLVREKYPNLENRGITKILGDWWSKLDTEQKSKYTDLARQHKEAFMKANPDFKWCKTPMSNNNNNSNTHNNSNSGGAGTGAATGSNSNDCQAAIQRHTDPIPPPIHVDAVQSNSKNSLGNTRQLEAPKPPKKRFLERNDSTYTRNNSTNIDMTMHARDGIVPYISLDQDTLDRVIDEAFSEKSNKSPSGTNNMCKCSDRISTNNSTSLIGVTNPTHYSTSTSSYSTSSSDEPVDFSMNRTINATSQQIINNLVERMLSGPSDNASGTSKVNGTDSAQSQAGFPVKRDNQEDT